MKRRRGIFILDAVLALSLLVALATALTACARRHSIAMRQLDDTRRAARLAESVMTSLQTRPSQEASTDREVHVSVEPLTDTAPASHQWVRVRVAVNERK